MRILDNSRADDPFRQIAAIRAGRVQLQSDAALPDWAAWLLAPFKREASAPERLGDLAMRLFAPAYGEPPLELPERETHEPMDFQG